MSKGFTLWFTGMSGAGKSTLANLLADELRARGHLVEVLDGDEIRTHLSKGLGFSKEDRDTNIRRIGYVARLLSRNGVIAISAAISPYRDVRDELRSQHERFFEVYMHCTIEKLSERDVKGLYKKGAGRRNQELHRNFRSVRAAGQSGPGARQRDRKRRAESRQVDRTPRGSRLHQSEGQMSSVANDAIAAHGGGELNDLKAPASERAALKSHAEKLPSVKLGARETADLEMLASGAFTPLTGFMGEADYKSSRDNMRLASGAPWSIPITLGVDEATARSLKTSSDIALMHDNGTRLAVMKLAEIYKVDREAEAKAVFGTSEDAHPGAKNVTSTPPYSLGGRVTLFEEIPGRTFMEYRLEPRDTRAAFRERGWKKIVAFQTPTRPIARTSTSRRPRWKFATVSCCIRWSARPRAMTCPPRSAWKPTRCSSISTTRRIA